MKAGISKIEMLIGVGIMFFKMPTLQGRKIPLQ
jgi:hypothetical protein